MKLKPGIPRLGAGLLALGLGLAACGGSDDDVATPRPDWPTVTSAIAKNPVQEEQIKAIVASMTLAQKVGQMTQPDIRSITPAEVTQYYIGSVLNGGGGWPGNNKRASVADWLALADAYWQASMATDLAVKIPVIWGTDAVHGHNNLYGATLFPHNIGLGAANDPDLIERIGAAVAAQVVATGIDWTFAPTLAVVRDDRWGRTYEGFSEEPSIVASYGGRYTRGLQGTFAGSGRPTVVATAKHFMGDGATDQGRDQGESKASLDEMITIHGAGYYPSLAAGAQTVMASFNSWTFTGTAPDGTPLAFDNVKMHGNKYLMTDVLKGRMGFDGLVVSDWDGIAQVQYRDAAGTLKSCSKTSCPPAINAGIDLVMVPNDWKQFIADTIADVESGAIPMSRIDDAVTRILRVKMRSGLMTVADGQTSSTKPSLRAGAGDANALVHRELAREAVRKSLVLLKNDNNVLPLARGQKILVVGRSADNLGNQTGGWSLTWQGTTNVNADFPAADTVLAGIREAAGADNVTYSPDGAGVDVTQYKAVIAVIGETPYAEGAGDIGRAGTLEHAKRYPADLAVLDVVKGQGVPVVTVLMSGRPVWVNKELNRSDAFVAAFLPGTEGKGVTDVLFRKEDGSVNVDFQGRLSFSWPKTACQTTVNQGDADYAPLFAFGSGKTYAAPGAAVGNALDETSPALGCGQTAGNGPAATEPLEIFNPAQHPQFKLEIGSDPNWHVPVGDDLNATVATSDGRLTVTTSQLNVQQDAKKLVWAGGDAEFKAMVGPSSNPTGAANLAGYTHPDAKAVLAFDIAVHQPPAGEVKVRVDCIYPCRGEADLTTHLKSLPLDVTSTVKIPLACFEAAGADFSTVDTPFLLKTAAAFSATVARVRWVVGASGDADTLTCAQVAPPPPPAIEPLPGPTATLMGGAGFHGDLKADMYISNGTHLVATPIAGGYDLQFLADGGNATFTLKGSGLNLANYANGTLSFDLKVITYGANTKGLAIKMESPGEGCRNVDYLLPDAVKPPADGQVHRITVPVADVVANENAPCFTLDNVVVPFGIFPAWDDQQGVRFEVANVVLTQ
ncbi:glycoside hydrolase family 3 N-terminal domain-containing protein [Rhizobacter sp. LjRoot28]|uniref:glycoside hydrolase family 3 N-terminal domain-containing protein n=1 Tax=Rhizobacter sp. LjRoot28 TaxID=3342309 RepID=UPI003ED01F5E